MLSVPFERNDRKQTTRPREWRVSGIVCHWLGPCTVLFPPLFCRTGRDRTVAGGLLNSICAGAPLAEAILTRTGCTRGESVPFRQLTAQAIQFLHGLQRCHGVDFHVADFIQQGIFRHIKQAQLP